MQYIRAAHLHARQVRHCQAVRGVLQRLAQRVQLISGARGGAPELSQQARDALRACVCVARARKQDDSTAVAEWGAAPRQVALDSGCPAAARPCCMCTGRMAG